MIDSSNSKDDLCCCEFIDYRGSRFHILAVCCDCEVLDDTCDRLITCRSVPSQNIRTLMLTVGDRLRIPRCGGRGAMRINTDIAIPIILVPAMIFLGALGPLWTIFSFTIIPSLCFYMYIRCLKQKTRFFYIWSLCSLVFLLGVMEVEVHPYMEIYLYENLLHKLFTAAMLICVYFVRGDPGILDAKSQGTFLLDEAEDIKKCSTCNILQINRAGHCYLCNTCIEQRDHHCIWIDCCIGSKNIRVFLFSLIFLILSTYYGALLTLTTICEPLLVFDFFLVPHDCTGIYDSIHLAVCFVSAVYALIIMFAALVNLLHQFHLISINMTGQEWRAVRQNNFWRRTIYSKGLLRNWYLFCSGQR